MNSSLSSVTFPGGQPSFAVGSDGTDLALRASIGAALVLLLSLPCIVIVVRSRFYTGRLAASAALISRPTWLTRRLVHTWHLPPWPLTLAANALPFLLLAGWAGALAPAEPDRCWVYGLGVALGGPAALLVLYAFLSWWQRNWVVSGRVLFSGALSLLCLLLLQLLLVVERPRCAATPSLAEFPHTATTAIAMALNLMPVSSLLYLGLSEAPHAPVKENVKSSTSFALELLGFRRAQRWPRVQAALSYALSLGLLALYSVMFYLADPNFDAAGANSTANASSIAVDRCVAANLTDLSTPVIVEPDNASGLYASITVVLIDVGVALYAAAGLAQSSLAPPILLMVVCRVALVATGRYGVAYIFMVHALVFFLAGVFVGGLVSMRRFREGNDPKHRLERLVKIKIKMPSLRLPSLMSFHAIKDNLHRFASLPHRKHDKPHKPTLVVPPFSPATSCSPTSALVSEESQLVSVRVSEQAPPSVRPPSSSSFEMDAPQPPPPPTPPPSPPAADGSKARAGGSNRTSGGMARISDATRDSDASEVDLTILSDGGGALGATWPAALAWLGASETPLVYLMVLHATSLGIAIRNWVTCPGLHPDIPFTILFRTAFPQWVILLAAGLLALFLVLCYNLYLRLQAHEWALAPLKYLAGAAFSSSAGLGALLFAFDATTRASTAEAIASDAFVVFVALMLGPCALLFLGRAAHKWHRAKMRLRTGFTSRDRQLALDVVLFFLCVLTFALVVALAGPAAGGDGSPQAAIVVSTFSVAFVFSAAALHKYLHTHRIDAFVSLTLFATALLIGLLVFLFVAVLPNRGRLEWVFVAAAGYPTAFVFLWTVLLWRSLSWRATRPVIVMLVVAMSLTLTMSIVLLQQRDVPVITLIGAALLLLWLLCLLSVSLALMWARISAGVGRLVFSSACAVVLIGVLAYGVASASGMLALSAVCFTTIGSLLFYGLFQQPGASHVRFGVLPVWAYDSDGCTTREANAPTFSLFAALAILLGWCALAAFTELQAVATLLSYLAAWLCYVVRRAARRSRVTASCKAECV